MNRNREPSAWIVGGPPAWAAGTGPASAGPAGAPVTYSRPAVVLDCRAPKMVERARDAGVTIRYLGMSPLFAETRAYAGPQTDWVIGPATDLGDAVVPKAERGALVQLTEAGVDFPMIYIAHEIPKGKLVILGDGSGPSSGPVTIDHADLDAALGPVPPPVAATALADRLGYSAQHLLRGLGMAIPVAGAIVAAPFMLAGAAVAAIGALALDPIVFGVIPAGRPVPGQLGAWYILAQWDWPTAPADVQAPPK